MQLASCGGNIHRFLSIVSSTKLCRFSGRHGGVEKRGGWKTSRMTPLPKRGFGPPSYGTFSTPLTCQCSVFPVQKSTTEQTRSSFGGVQKFSGERVLWYVFHPPYVLHPPISRPKLGLYPVKQGFEANCTRKFTRKFGEILVNSTVCFVWYLFCPLENHSTMI